MRERERLAWELRQVWGRLRHTDDVQAAEICLKAATYLDEEQKAVDRFCEPREEADAWHS